MPCGLVLVLCFIYKNLTDFTYFYPSVNPFYEVFSDILFHRIVKYFLFADDDHLAAIL